MICKKPICIIVAFFLLLTQTGFSFNVHFCDSKIASIALHSTTSTFENEKNCCGDVEKESKCCHNKIIKSIEKSETVFLKSIIFTPEFAVLSTCYLPAVLKQINVCRTTQISSYYCDSNAPPLFKVNCQLVFYA